MPPSDPTPRDRVPEPPIDDSGTDDALAFPPDDAGREDVIRDDLPGRPEQDVLTLDPDDVMPDPGDAMRMDP